MMLARRGTSSGLTFLITGSFKCFSLSMYCEVFLFSFVSLFTQPHKVSLRCAISLPCADLLDSALCLVLGLAGPLAAGHRRKAHPSSRGRGCPEQQPPAGPERCGTAASQHRLAPGSSEPGWHRWGLQGWAALGSFSMCLPWLWQP